MAVNEFAPVTPGEMPKEEFVAGDGLAQTGSRRPSVFHRTVMRRSNRACFGARSAISRLGEILGRRKSSMQRSTPGNRLR